MAESITLFVGICWLAWLVGRYKRQLSAAREANDYLRGQVLTLRKNYDAKCDEIQVLRAAYGDAVEIAHERQARRYR